MRFAKFDRFVIAILLIGTIVLVNLSPTAHAVAQLVQTNKNTASGATSVSVSFAAGPVANDLLIAICGASTASTITPPSGFSTAKNESGTPSQGIFYKVATGSEGTTALSCGGGTTSTRWGIQIYEYSNMATASPLDAVNTVSSSGTGTSPSSGTVVTTNANDLLIAGITSSTNTSISSWTNSFVSENGMTIAGGTKMAYGGADRVVSASGTYSAGATAGNAAWRGQIAAFKSGPVVLTADIVDGSGASVATPSVAMSATTASFSCQTVTGTLGDAAQKIRVNNTTANGAWTISVAASGSNWVSGLNTYSYNNPAASGCTGGQLTVQPASGTITPQSGCNNTAVTTGSNTAFSSGIVSSITLVSASASAGHNCYWDLTGVGLSQKIPAGQKSGAYSIGLTLTVVAN
jgi:hypothetical protein